MEFTVAIGLHLSELSTNKKVLKKNEWVHSIIIQGISNEKSGYPLDSMEISINSIWPW